MITTNRSMRRATKGATAGGEQATGRGVPRRALADGVVERRRTSRRRSEPVVGAPPPLSASEPVPLLLSPTEHYRREVRRRADRMAGDLASLLAEAKAEYEAQINAPRPAGKGGRPKKQPAAPAAEIDLADEDALGVEEE